jgi:hypothetical protein
MNNKFFTDIKIIRNAIDTKKLVVFAGAGISIDAGIPGWYTLIDEMKSEIDIPRSEQDYLRIAQMYFNDREQKEYIDKVRSTLKHKKIRHNEIHEEILNLNPEHILTTNYDDLLEQVIRKKSLPFSVVSRDQQFPYALNTNLLVKIHGDLDDTDFVLKEDDYIDYSLNHPLIEAFIKSVFASKTVLFVGYGFSDINLKMIIQTVRNILGTDFQSAYLLSVDENFHPTQREYLKKKGVNVINYFDAQNTEQSNYISDYLNGNNALNKVYFKKVEALSDKGQNLYNFLRFVSTYDKFNEPITEKNVIDQVYLSLNRFSELRSLPPDFVANLYPFNNSNSYVHNYERYSLLTSNSKLHDLFFDQIEFSNNEIRFKPPVDLNLSPSQVKDYEQKLTEIIETLNFSLVLYIFKENEKPDSFGTYGWSDTYQTLKVKNPVKCNCLSCRLSRFELSNVVSYALNNTIDETTNIKSDLELAYINYKVGNFLRAFRLFEEVADKAWQIGKYFSYYIAKHNIKTLHNLIYWHESNLSEDEKKRILQELKDIDFDKLLFQIPYMGEAEYELLKTIRDDKVLENAAKDIDYASEKILDAFNQYKDGRGFILGPYYPQTIEIAFYKISTFYSNNYIIADEFSRFQNVYRKGIEAMLVSYATSNEYEQKLKEFNKAFFDFAVNYGDPKGIRVTCAKYQIDEITFDEKSLPEIIEAVNTYLKSFFSVSTFFGRMTHPETTLKNQTGNSFFKEKCRKHFSNIFLILSGIKLKNEDAGDLIINLNEFLLHEAFLHQTEIEYLSAFIYKNYQLFSDKDFEDLLKSVSEKIKLYEDGDFFHAIAFAYKQNNFSGINNRDLIFDIVHSIRKLSRSESSDILIELWTISDESTKEELKQLIIKELDEKFEDELFTKASYKGIIDFNKYFEQYIAEINKKKGNGSYTLHEGRPRPQSFEFLNSMLFIYRMGIEEDDKRLYAFTGLADYMSFLLYPEKFNYENFKPEWLYLVNGWDVFYKRFSKIPAFKKQFEKALKKKYDSELAEMYVKYFLTE